MKGKILETYRYLDLARIQITCLDQTSRFYLDGSGSVECASPSRKSRSLQDKVCIFSLKCKSSDENILINDILLEKLVTFVTCHH